MNSEGFPPKIFYNNSVHICYYRLTGYIYLNFCAPSDFYFSSVLISEVFLCWTDNAQNLWCLLLHLLHLSFLTDGDDLLHTYTTQPLPSKPSPRNTDAPVENHLSVTNALFLAVWREVQRKDARIPSHPPIQQTGCLPLRPY